LTETNSTSNRPVKIILVLLGIALALWLCWISMPVLIPFLVGILLAYLLMPLVIRLEKALPPKGKEKKFKRAIAVIIVFILFIILLIVFMAYIGAAMVAASSALVSKAPEFVNKGMGQVGEWLNFMEARLSADIVAQIKKAAAEAGPAIGKFMQDFVAGSVAVIPSSLPTILGFITLPFFLIFVLINYEKYGQYFNDIFPATMARHSTRILSIFGGQMGRYMRYQIILAAIVGMLVSLGMAILGVEYAVALGAVAAFTQVIPIIGPFISGAIILVVTLALKPEVILGAIVVIAAAQLVVGLAQGFVQEKHFPLDPAVVMVLMTVGGFIGSYWGIILALPVGATVWDIYKYLRDDRRAQQANTEVA
jgi:predicted PurR-regulated permease PerM